MSLQTGGEIARTTKPVIDPKSLAIIAYEVDGPLLESKPSIIRIADVREIGDAGFIIDSIDELTIPGDVIKIDELRSFRFSLDGIKVFDEKKRHLGKVIDYTLEVGGFIIQQLTVKRPLIQSLTDTELLIHRSQIIEIRNDAIIVHSEAKAPEPERHEVIGSYTNPFRSTEPTTE